MDDVSIEPIFPTKIEPIFPTKKTAIDPLYPTLFACLFCRKFYNKYRNLLLNSSILFTPTLVLFPGFSVAEFSSRFPGWFGLVFVSLHFVYVGLVISDMWMAVLRAIVINMCLYTSCIGVQWGKHPLTYATTVVNIIATVGALIHQRMHVQPRYASLMQAQRAKPTYTSQIRTRVIHGTKFMGIEPQDLSHADRLKIHMEIERQVQRTNAAASVQTSIMRGCVCLTVRMLQCRSSMEGRRASSEIDPPTQLQLTADTVKAFLPAEIQARVTGCRSAQEMEGAQPDVRCVSKTAAVPAMSDAHTLEFVVVNWAASKGDGWQPVVQRGSTDEEIECEWAWDDQQPGAFRVTLPQLPHAEVVNVGLIRRPADATQSSALPAGGAFVSDGLVSLAVLDAPIYKALDALEEADACSDLGLIMSAVLASPPAPTSFVSVVTSMASYVEARGSQCAPLRSFLLSQVLPAVRGTKALAPCDPRTLCRSNVLGLAFQEGAMERAYEAQVASYFASRPNKIFRTVNLVAMTTPLRFDILREPRIGLLMLPDLTASLMDLPLAGLIARLPANLVIITHALLTLVSVGLFAPYVERRNRAKFNIQFGIEDETVLTLTAGIRELTVFCVYFFVLWQRRGLARWALPSLVITAVHLIWIDLTDPTCVHPAIPTPIKIAASLAAVVALAVQQWRAEKRDRLAFAERHLAAKIKKNV